MYSGIRTLYFLHFFFFFWFFLSILHIIQLTPHIFLLQVDDIEKFYPGTVAGIREWILSNSLSNLMYSGIRALYFVIFELYFLFYFDISHIKKTHTTTEERRAEICVF